VRRNQRHLVFVLEQTQRALPVVELDAAGVPEDRRARASRCLFSEAR